MKNKKVFLKLFPILCVFMLTIGAHVVLADNCVGEPGSDDLLHYDCTFENQVGGPHGNSIADFIQFIYEQLMPIAMMIAALVILIAGFRYVAAVSGGKADMAVKAKELFVPALIGVLIIVGGSAILKAVIILANSIK